MPKPNKSAVAALCDCRIDLFSVIGKIMGEEPQSDILEVKQKTAE
jgi:hypothetical protein